MNDKILQSYFFPSYLNVDVICQNAFLSKERKSNNAFQYAPTIHISTKRRKKGKKGHIFLGTEKKIIKKKKNSYGIKKGYPSNYICWILCTVSHHS